MYFRFDRHSSVVLDGSRLLREVLLLLTPLSELPCLVVAFAAGFELRYSAAFDELATTGAVRFVRLGCFVS